MVRDVDEVVRVLAPSEERFVRHGTYTGRSVSVVGELDIAALGAAFAAVQRTYPVLTCRITEEARRGYLLRPGEWAPVGMWLSEGDPGSIRVPAEPIDPLGQLAYLDVTLSPMGRTRVTLFAHHSIADAGHCVALFARLWDCYTDQVESGTTTVVPQDYPQSLEWHTATKGIARGPVSGLEDVTCTLPPQTAAANIGAHAPAALVRPRRTILDRAATARLIGSVRGPGVTVNGLITAALMRAYAAEKVEAIGDPVAVGCLYPVDLRARLDPPVAATAGTNMAGLASFAADIDRSGTVVELAQQVSSRLCDDLARGIVQQSVLHFPDFFGSTRIHSLAGHVAVTNTGAVPAFRTPDTIELADYEIIYLSAHPRPSAGASAAITFLVYTFAGCLTVGLIGGGPDADHIRTAVHTELTNLSVQAVGRGIG